jgi:hypothetical protein
VALYSQLRNFSFSEVAAMIEGLIRHDTEMRVEKNFVDSHGQSEVAFAFCHLLGGIRLMPRLKRIKYGRCLTGVDVLCSLHVSETEYPQRDRVASCFSQSCTVLTVTGPLSSAMAAPGKANNGTGAASTAGLAVLSSWTRAIQANRLRSKSSSSRWR